MNSPSTPEKSGNQSFPSDIDYLTAEFEWMRVRARRIEFQRELEEQSGMASKRYTWRGRSIQEVVGSIPSTSTRGPLISLRFSLFAR